MRDLWGRQRGGQTQGWSSAGPWGKEGLQERLQEMLQEDWNDCIGRAADAGGQDGLREDSYDCRMHDCDECMIIDYAAG